MKTRHIVLLAAALLMATPAITTLTGCGGGNGGPFIGNQSINNLPVAFGNGQFGQLDLGIANRAINAVLRVLPTPVPLVGKANSIAAQALPQLPEGTYTGVGTIDSSGNFSITFDLVAPAPDIVITGKVPTLSSTGSYTVTVSGQSVSGTFPSLGQNTPTPTASGTPTATATPIPNGDRIAGTLSGKTGANVTGAAFDQPLKSSTVSNTPGQRIFSAIYEDRAGTLWRSISLEVQPTVNLAAGQDFSLSNTGGSISYFEALNSNPSGTAKNWDSISGTLHIDSVQNGIVRFTVLNARLQARVGDQATGSFTLSGTGQARTSFGTGG